jgi:hypothetical protein
MSPRITLQRVLREDPDYGVLPITLAVGAASIAFNFVARDASTIPNYDPLGLTEPRTVEPAWLWISPFLAGGLIVELAQLYVGAYLLSILGAWQGSRAGTGPIRAAVAWANLPAVFGLLLLCLVGVVTPTPDPEGDGQAVPLNFVGSALALASIAAALWSWALYFRFLVDVLHIALWRCVVINLLTAIAAAAVIFVLASFTLLR